MILNQARGIWMCVGQLCGRGRREVMGKIFFIEDGIAFCNTGWYFYDETGRPNGPYHSRMEALAQLKDYALNYLGENI
jgi:hypothetical protein